MPSVVEVTLSISNMEIDKTLIHNHPPSRQIYNNCPYCSKFGNVFDIKDLKD